MRSARASARASEPAHPSNLVLEGKGRDARISSNLYAGEKTWIVTAGSQSRTFKTLQRAVMWGRAAIGDSTARLVRSDRDASRDSSPRISHARQEWISKKIRLLRHEGYPERQAIAIAYREAGVAKPRGH